MVELFDIPGGNCPSQREKLSRGNLSAVKCPEGNCPTFKLGVCEVIATLRVLILSKNNNLVPCSLQQIKEWRKTAYDCGLKQGIASDLSGFICCNKVEPYVKRRFQRGLTTIVHTLTLNLLDSSEI